MKELEQILCGALVGLSIYSLAKMDLPFALGMIGFGLAVISVRQVQANR